MSLASWISSSMTCAAVIALVLEAAIARYVPHYDQFQRVVRVFGVIGQKVVQ